MSFSCPLSPSPPHHFLSLSSLPSMKMAQKAKQNVSNYLFKTFLSEVASWNILFMPCCSDNGACVGLPVCCVSHLYVCELSHV